MKKTLVFILLILNLKPVLHAQNWEVVGYMNQEANKLLFDPASQKLIAGGFFCFLDGDTVAGIASWDGTSFNRLGCGLNWNCTSSLSAGCFVDLYGIESFQNKIYATGYFNYAGGVPAQNIASFDGNNWESTLPGLNGLGRGLKLYNNELYVHGTFDSIAGIKANGLAKFNGQSWEPVHNLPKISPDSYPNSIYSLEFYEDEIYIGGQFYDDISGNSIFNIAKWDGNNWVRVGTPGTGIYGGMAEVTRMVVFQNELYVAGNFTKSQSPMNPGNGIAKWDGTNWSDVGGGLENNAGMVQVKDMFVFNNELYISGFFNKAGGVPLNTIAKWNGEDWCSLGSNNIFTNVTALGSYRDTLYIGGVNTNSNPYTWMIAKWTGGTFVDTCGNTTSIKEVDKVNKIGIFPNPASNEINFQNINKASTIKLFDFSGKLIITEMLNNKENHQIDISTLPAGLYIIVVENEEGVFREKLVKK